MIVLDTDHLGEFQKSTSSAGKQLRDRLQNCGQPVATTIISVEEQMRGWLAAIHKQRDIARQTGSYQRLGSLFRFFAAWHVLQWDGEAVAQFQRLRQQQVRIGTMDLKIASICLVHDATVLTRNLRDFQCVPGLKVEDWLGAE